MFEVLLLALEVLKDEAHPLGLEVNWQKTKIQSTIDIATLPQPVPVSGNSVDIVAEGRCHRTIEGCLSVQHLPAVC